MSNDREKRQKKRPPLPEWLAVRLDIPPDLLEGGVRIELRGRASVTVHGCCGIAEYRPERILLSLPDGAVAVHGQRLICTSYLAGAVGIDGQIDGVAFCGMDGKEPDRRAHADGDDAAEDDWEDCK